MSNFENYENVEKMRVVENKKCINPNSNSGYLHYDFVFCKLNNSEKKFGT